jgi:hypothetical protein
VHASGSTDQMQDGQQVTTICQGAAPDPCDPTTTNTGTNTANVSQARWADAHASGGDITQLQDNDPGTDCFSGPFSPTAPNLCALVTRTRKSGTTWP